MKKLTAIVVGYGSRGSAYASFAMKNPDQLQIVAVADPNPIRQQTAMQRHGLTEEKIYNSWENIVQLPRMADFAIVGTQDNMHYGPAMALIEKGYHLLLEKPMAPTPEECARITEAAERKGVHVMVCHVLRFTQFWRAIKNILDSGRIGKPMSIMHMENVGHIHQSHSFVRGNWRNSKESNSMLMQKSCHDMDILQWLVGERCAKIQSFGGLHHFTRENMPAGAPDRCVKGCPVAEQCHYNAVKLYYDDKDNLWFRSVAAKTIDMPTDEQVMEAITYGPYGRCVYQCDNDVVDHQTVNMEFEGGCTAACSMTAFNEGGRYIRIFGTEGELVSSMSQNTLQVFSFQTRQWEAVEISAFGNDITSGHGGGDEGIMVDFLSLLRGETPSKSVCPVRTSYENHLMAFAAEESRHTNRVVSLTEYEERT